MLYGPDGNPIRSEKSGPVEIDLADLTPEEQVTVLWLRAIQPGAQPFHVQELQQRLLGKSAKESDALILAGIDGLLARGFLAPARDAHGNVVLDAQGRPAVDVVGKLVSRMRAVESPRH